MFIPEDIVPKVYVLVFRDDVMEIEKGSLRHREVQYEDIYDARPIVDGKASNSRVLIPLIDVTGASYDASDSD